MLPEELLRKVRHIELTTRKVVNDVMSGSFRSHFKGHGVQFSEHRLYVPGDDVRHIDWKVSARTRDPLIKKFEEERELTVLLVVDVSGSQSFGSSTKLKSEIAAEVGGMLAYAAIHTGDKVGVLFFAGEVESFIPPRKGRSHILRIIRDILAYRPKSRGTDLAGALTAANRIMKHSGVVFVISDFIVPTNVPVAASGVAKAGISPTKAAAAKAGPKWDIPMKRLARRHDVVAVQIRDERELEIPNVGQMIFVDPETGEERLIDTSSYAFRKWLGELRASTDQATAEAFRSGRIETLRVLTSEDYGDAVVRFFRTRAARRSRRG